MVVAASQQRGRRRPAAGLGWAGASIVALLLLGLLGLGLAATLQDSETMKITWPTQHVRR